MGWLGESLSDLSVHCFLMRCHYIKWQVWGGLIFEAQRCFCVSVTKYQLFDYYYYCDVPNGNELEAQHRTVLSRV